MVGITDELQSVGVYAAVSGQGDWCLSRRVGLRDGAHVNRSAVSCCQRTTAVTQGERGCLAKRGVRIKRLVAREVVGGSVGRPHRDGRGAVRGRDKARIRRYRDVALMGTQSAGG